MDNWEAKVIFSPGRIAANVFLYRRRQPGIREFVTGDQEITTIKEGEPLKDDEVILVSLDDDQLHALQKAITEYGIKPPEASFVQGKAEAMSEHLADMRKLVFEPGVIKVIQKGKVE